MRRGDRHQQPALEQDVGTQVVERIDRVGIERDHGELQAPCPQAAQMRGRRPLAQGHDDGGVRAAQAGERARHEDAERRRERTDREAPLQAVA